MRALLLLAPSLLAVPGCAGTGPNGPSGTTLTVTDGDPTAPADECNLPCFTVEVRRDGVAAADVPVALTLDATGPAGLPTGLVTDADGRVEVCPEPAAIPVESRLLRIAAGDAVLDLTPDVRPFGWDVGLDKRAGAPDAVERFPQLQHPAEPFFAPAADTFYSYQITHPFLTDDNRLYFGGTDAYRTDDNNPYQLGRATLEDGAVTHVEGPLFSDTTTGWGARSRNAPEVHAVTDGLAMWFQGYLEDGGSPAIGRATSSDGGDTWTLDPGNPIYDNPDTDGGAHPTLRVHDGGVVELWHAGLGGIMYALSTDDGQTFEPFCANPVLPRLPEEAGFKSPQVVWLDDRYAMAPTQGEERILWAESFDGLRWRRASEPALRPGDASWYDTSVAGAQILPGPDGISLLFVGVGTGTPRTGLGIATPVR
jgi:hypothetical protein